jgi:DUF4097 and DUF4098 domain-containing protein YvlB
VSHARLSATVAVLSLAGAACGLEVGHEGVVEREERQFAVQGGPAELRLDTFNGSIEVRTWDRQEVLVRIDRRAQDQTALANIEIVTGQKGNVISFEARSSNRPAFGIGLFASPSARFVATVPADTNVVLRSGDGSVLVERVAGRVEIRTGDGSIRVAETSGDLLAETGDGGIQLSDISGRIQAWTGDGTIQASGTPGSLHVRSGNGSIVLRIGTGTSMSDDWTIATDDGSITLELPDDFAADIEADPGSDGRVRNDLELTKAAGGTREGRALRGTLGAGGHRLSLRTGDGTIRLVSY